MRLEGVYTGKDSLKENKIKEEVLASGAAFAIAEHIKTLGIDGETTDEQEEEIGEIGRGVALIEYQQIKNDEDETKTLQKDAADRYAKLLHQVEEAARQAAAELFASSSAGEKIEVELPTIEGVGLEAAKAHYEKHELAEDNELKIKLETTGKNAAKAEYAKLKAERESSEPLDENPIMAEIEKVARSKYEKLSESVTAEMDGEKETDAELKESELKLAVEQSGADAAVAEFDKLLTGEGDTEESEADNAEDKAMMEEAGRLVAEEEYLKLKEQEKEKARAADDLAERQ